MPLGDNRCYGGSRGDLHFIIDFPRPHVQHTSEKTGKAKGIVDLVGVVRPAGRHDPHVARDFLGPYFRVGVGKCEHDGIVRHSRHLIRCSKARAGETQHEVCAL